MTPGLGTRDQLLDDLSQAIEPDRSPGVLVVFRIDRFAAFVSEQGLEASEAFVGTAADLLRCAVGPAARLYRPRRHEVCALVPSPPPTITPALAGAVLAVDEAGEAYGVTVGLGTATVPGGADHPVRVLQRADLCLGRLGQPAAA